MMKIEKDAEKAFNELARMQAKHKLLLDISFDVQICKLKGWNYKEYIQELIDMLKGLLDEC